MTVSPLGSNLIHRISTFRWNNELCTWLPQLFCVHWCSLPWKARCFHCCKCLNILFLNYIIFPIVEPQTIRVLHYLLETVCLYNFMFYHFLIQVEFCGGPMCWSTRTISASAGRFSNQVLALLSYARGL